MKRVFLNGKETSLCGEGRLLQLLEDQSLAQKRGIAVAVNNQVVPKTTWASYPLNENDKVLIIQASQGG